MINDVSITTGARLHFGPLSVAAPAGGRFGGVGVMIDAPRTVLKARRDTTDSVSGDPKSVERVTEFLRRAREHLAPADRVACRITVLESIPSHCGFGSGTQLGLAVASMASHMTGESQPALPMLARRVQRGMRSAIGLYGFQQGGFLVDGGRLEANQLGTLVSRVDFPDDWRFVLAMPLRATGLSGDAEQSAFVRQPPMPTTLTAELCRVVLMDWLPAVIEQDFSRCSESMFAFGHAVGEFFTPTQGGVFAHPRMASWANHIRRAGVQGVAQTSWGPTLAALCSSHSHAEQVCHDFSHDTAWSDCSFRIVSPLNRGAHIEVA